MLTLLLRLFFFQVQTSSHSLFLSTQSPQESCLVLITGMFLSPPVSTGQGRAGLLIITMKPSHAHRLLLVECLGMTAHVSRPLPAILLLMWLNA